jgi:FkbM family methyltransferase
MWKTKVKKTILDWVQTKIKPTPDHFFRLSYAQEGEDILLASLFGLFEKDRMGFYVDVGAHHPQFCSNTYFFYLRGWRGINIDAMPGSMQPFDRLRPEDKNLEVAVSDCKKVLTYYAFNAPVLNGFSREVAEQRDNYKGHKILWQKDIETSTLTEILDQHLPPKQAIDLLSVDVEGLDYEVLKSNDWGKYRPSIVLVEDSETQSLLGEADSMIVRFMRQQGYVPCCKTPLTLFFVERDEIAVSPFGMRLKRYM